MIGTIITLGIFCLVFGIMIAIQDQKNADLIADNARLKGRMESMGQTAPEKDSDGEKALTLEGIADAVRHTGFTPVIKDDCVDFKVGEERFFIDASRLPALFVSVIYTVDKEEWNLDILQRAAHLMSDELIMVKATFQDSEERTTLRFFIAALDRTATSLKYNLKYYLNIIDDANRRLNDLYKELSSPASDTIKANDSIAS